MNHIGAILAAAILLSALSPAIAAGPPNSSLSIQIYADGSAYITQYLGVVKFLLKNLG